MQQRILFLLLLTMIAIPGFGQNNPYAEDLSLTAPSKVVTPADTTKAVEPPVVSGTDAPSTTPEALVAENTLQDLINKLQAYVKAKNWKAAADALAHISKVTTDARDKKGNVLPGLFTQMTTGGLDQARIDALKGRFTSLKNQMYLEGAAAMVREGRNFEDYNTSKGPGGGNVACAWLMSKVLQAAGMVPAGWMEPGALALTQRLVKEFKWKKVPSTGGPNKGSITAKSMKPGDIIFWDPSDHVGVYLGDGMAMSNSSSAHVGTIHPVSGYYDGWKPRFVVRPPGGA